MSDIQKPEIRVETDNGTIVVTRNPDPDYDGVSIAFETENGDIVDIVLVECKTDNRDKIDVYSYTDEYSEEWTNKFTLDTNKLLESVK